MFTQPYTCKISSVTLSYRVFDKFIPYELIKTLSPKSFINGADIYYISQHFVSSNQANYFTIYI